MVIEVLPGGGEIIAERSTRSQRYRAVRTPNDYLVTARSRDAVGAVIVAEWLHRTEEAAIACMTAVEAGNAAFEAIMQGLPAGELLGRYERLSEAHRAICDRLGDFPLIGREVRDLRYPQG